MPLRYKSQNCLVLGLADITAQQRAEARLAQANLQLEDAVERASAMALLAELRAKEAETAAPCGRYRGGYRSTGRKRLSTSSINFTGW